MHNKDNGMGFKSLGTFNTAMLGKQGWRIMTNPDTLISRMYKAKYFSRCNFLDSTLGHNPSFVWRSICNFKFILRVGSRWRMGDGSSIPVWINNWLLDNIVITPRVSDGSPLADLRVKDCLLQDLKAWNVPFLQANFSPQLVEHIIQTPLYPSVTKDRLVRKKEIDGEYSARSTYRMCM